MLRRLFSKLAQSSHTPLEAQAINDLHQLFGSCLICSRGLVGHRVMELCSAHRESTIAAVLRSVRERNWNELLSIKEWDPEANNLVVYVTAGVHPGGMIVAVRSPHELYENDEVFSKEILSSVELNALETLAADMKWDPL